MHNSWDAPQVTCGFSAVEEEDEAVGKLFTMGNPNADLRCVLRAEPKAQSKWWPESVAVVGEWLR